MSGHVKARFSMTLFVENFPFQWNNIALRECFEKHCKVVDAYVANKLSKRKSKFGFIRVDSLVDVNALIQVMNGTVVGKRKLFVSISKFSKSPTKSGDVVPRGGFIHGNNMRAATSKTFVEALIGRAEKCKESVPGVKKGFAIKPSINTTEVMDISFVSQVSVEEWLDRSVVCSVEPHQMELFPAALSKTGIWSARVRPLGGEDVLVTFSSIAEMKSHLGSLKQLCKKCEPWTIHFVPSTRRAWVQILGLPIHMWSKETMENLVAPIGNLVRIHQDTEEKKRLDVAWVLVSVPSTMRVQRQFKVSVQGKSYQVSIAEILLMDEGYYGDTVRWDISGNQHPMDGTSVVEVVPETARHDDLQRSPLEDQSSENSGMPSPRGYKSKRNISTETNSPLTQTILPSQLVGNIMAVTCSTTLERVSDTFEVAQQDNNIKNPIIDVLGSLEDPVISEKANLVQDFGHREEALDVEVDVVGGEGNLSQLDNLESRPTKEQYPDGPIRNSNRNRKPTAKGLAFNCSIKKKVAFIPPTHARPFEDISQSGQNEASFPQMSSSSAILEARAIKASLIGKRLGITWDAEEGEIISELKDALMRGRVMENTQIP